MKSSSLVSPVSRRKFVVGSAVAGSGLALGINVPALAKNPESDHGKDSRQDQNEVNVWAVINPDDSVIVRIVRSEMGQGTLTGLAQLVAEELDCDWSKVSTEQPTPGTSLARNRPWQSYATGGSRGIRQSNQYVREGGAAAKQMLLEAAAMDWQVPISECIGKNSIITHTPSGKTKRYGEVAAAAAKLAPPLDVVLKDPKDWTIAGQPVKRLDTADKLTGKQIYGADVRLPGLVNAAIKACPVNGGLLTSFDAKAIAKMPGVLGTVQVDDTAVAVVAKTWWQAKTALDALPITWDKGANAKESSKTIDQRLQEGLAATKAVVGNKSGDAAKAIENAAQTVEAEYFYPFQNHATMEPMNATALWSDTRCEVWCPTQNGEAALAATSEASGLALEQCEVYKLNLGGGFGRRGGSHDFVRQAVAIAKQFPNTPVKLLWTREEDMQHGMYHPITKAKMVAGLDSKGKLSGLHMRISGQSILATLAPQAIRDGKDPAQFQGVDKAGDHSISYSVPDLLVDHAMRNTHLRPGFFRGVNVNQNAVYMESFMDELAHAAQRDALVFRRELMADNPKGLAVLEKVAAEAKWGTPMPKGSGRGLAICHAFGSYVAACAEVSVDKRGKLSIDRIVAATDSGYAVNPQQVEAQVEGSFVYGLSAMLYGQCTVEDGEVVQSNFHDYPSMRIADMPKVETHVMPSGGFWGGVGEPTISVAAPAVLNAIYNATGKRIRQLPIGNQDLTPV